jgi:hypothetical protein
LSMLAMSFLISYRQRPAFHAAHTALRSMGTYACRPLLTYQYFRSMSEFEAQISNDS